MSGAKRWEASVKFVCFVCDRCGKREESHDDEWPEGSASSPVFSDGARGPADADGPLSIPRSSEAVRCSLLDGPKGDDPERSGLVCGHCNARQTCFNCKAAAR